MGTIHRFPAIPKKRNDPHFCRLSQTTADFVCQLECIQELPGESLWKLAEASLSAVLDRLETALADLDAIGRLLPPGEFKTRFDLDRTALATQLDLSKGRTIDLWEQMDLVWE